ncbi:MAG: flagellar biosynthetic protein FliQ [Archangiaceae bacterium]|nr:flagellar biosynthetic protein FliQ [Archangiaceae bacterium]
MDTLVRDGAEVLATVGAPFILALLAIGTVVGVLQAATQINDPALGSVPRLLVAVGVAVSMGGWVAERLAAFLSASIGNIANGP